MKSLMTLLFFMAFMADSWGQFCSSFSFTYDNAGNRIKRQFVVCFAPDDGDVVALRSVAKDNKPLQNGQMTKVNLLAYPNPNNGVFEVVIDKSLENTVLELYDFTGRKVNTQVVKTSRIPMTVNDLAAGSYMIVYRNTEKVLGQMKIIIE